jgi:anaerobic ribonucleoside-triphosphate reductase activating protein
MVSHELNIGRLLPYSQVNGPGSRFVIWLQGCDRRCPGCVNRELWSHAPNQLLSVKNLYEQIMTTPGIEGVTYSGGEPFQQAEGLYALSVLLKEAGLTILSYSGYTYQELLTSPNQHVSALLSTLGMLIDGPFVQAQAAALLWRGSKNQQVRFLSERYKDYETLVHRTAQDMEFVLNENGLGLTGNFDENLLQKITDKLQQDYGIVLTRNNRNFSSTQKGQFDV